LYLTGWAAQGCNRIRKRTNSATLEPQAGMNSAGIPRRSRRREHVENSDKLTSTSHRSVDHIVDDIDGEQQRLVNVEVAA
jgi:hypothetical protein